MFPDLLFFPLRWKVGQHPSYSKSNNKCGQSGDDRPGHEREEEPPACIVRWGEQRMNGGCDRKPEPPDSYGYGYVQCR